MAFPAFHFRIIIRLSLFFSVILFGKRSEVIFGDSPRKSLFGRSITWGLTLSYCITKQKTKAYYMEDITFITWGLTSNYWEDFY